MNQSSPESGDKQKQKPNAEHSIKQRPTQAANQSMNASAASTELIMFAICIILELNIHDVPASFFRSRGVEGSIAPLALALHRVAFEHRCAWRRSRGKFIVRYMTFSICVKHAFWMNAQNSLCVT
jgi:hypothetical protein